MPQTQNTTFYTNYTQGKQEIAKNKYIDNPNIKKIFKVTKLDKNFTSKAYEILFNCRVDEISWIEKIDNIDNAYFMHLENISEPIKVSFKDNEIEYVFFDTWNLYQNGKNDGELSDYSVMPEEKTQLWILARENIRTNLKYPKMQNLMNILGE